MSKRLRTAMFTVLLATAFGDAARGAPEAYRVDSARTVPRLSVDYFGYSLPLARFNRASGRIILDKVSRTASADVNLDTESIDTGYPAVDQILRSEEFLHAVKYPKAVFRSSRIHFVGDRPVRIDGSLTLRGVTRPVSLVVNSFRRLTPPGRNRETLAVAAVSTVKRSDFGVGRIIPNVGDEVRVDIEIEVSRE